MTQDQILPIHNCFTSAKEEVAFNYFNVICVVVAAISPRVGAKSRYVAGPVAVQRFDTENHLSTVGPFSRALFGDNGGTIIMR